jgi:uncharacterized protein YdhG (YjbR/CyaY superfamily)
MAAPSSVDEYISALPEDRRAPMQELRGTVNAAAPEATETIAYGMPALRSHGGQFLVSYAAYKRHYSLFPSTEAVEKALGQELVPYLAGKGTIRFPADKPLPLPLIASVVRIRFVENEARARR